MVVLVAVEASSRVGARWGEGGRGKRGEKGGGGEQRYTKKYSPGIQIHYSSSGVHANTFSRFANGLGLGGSEALVALRFWGF